MTISLLHISNAHQITLVNLLSFCIDVLFKVFLLHSQPILQWSEAMCLSSPKIILVYTGWANAASLPSAIWTAMV